MKQTYTGGCHCGAIRYEADLDLSKGTLRCNCSICSKGRVWLVAVSADDFRLLRGADALSEYQFAAHRIHHLFCKHCGIKSFSRGDGAEGKQFVAVVVSCLDDIPDTQLAALPIIYVDGRNDNFQAAPAQTSHL
jgi:hypothetical protein